MTREESIALLNCAATELVGTLGEGGEVSVVNQSLRYIEALDMAISALREQEERSKGCEFCKGAKYIYGELSASGHVDDDHDFVHEQYGDLPICPMCGRRLEEV